jgi:predicted nucleic-acid-binding Zn-ribbon protein
MVMSASETPPAAEPRPCPMCGNTDIRKVRRLSTGGGLTGNTFLALRWGEISAVGRFEALVCRKCGHAEIVLADPEALDKMRVE